MTEPNRSLGIGQPITTWVDLPRWQRLAAFWAALLIAVGFGLKIGQSEIVFVLLFTFLAGRLSCSLFQLKPTGR